MASLNNSSGYGTDLSSALDDEENCDDTSSESGVESLTSSPCEGHTKSEKFEQKKQRGFKKSSGRSGHHARVAGREDQGLRDQEAQEQSWPQRGRVFTNVPAWWAMGEEQGVSQGMTSPAFSCSFTINLQGGQEGFQRRGECEEGRLRGVCSLPLKQSQTRRT